MKPLGGGSTASLYALCGSAGGGAVLGAAARRASKSDSVRPADAGASAAGMVETHV